MRTIKQTTSNKFLNIKEIFDPENHCKGYQFAERRGIDSIAFICIDRDTNLFLVNNEYTPPANEFLLRAFGGSLDKAKSKEEIVREELKEEAGYEVAEDKIHFVGSAFVSTQMNQRCFLYLIDITKAKNTGRKPENAMEGVAMPTKLTVNEILDGEDWKAITIINKAIRLGIIGYLSK